MDTSDVPMRINEEMEANYVPISVKQEMETNEIPAQVKGVDTNCIPVHVDTNCIPVHLKDRMGTYGIPVHVKHQMETNFLPVQIKKEVETPCEIKLGMEIENLLLKEEIETNDDPVQIKEELTTDDMSLQVNEENESDDVPENENDGMKSDDVLEHEKGGMESDDVPVHEKDVIESNDVREYGKDGMESNDVPEHEQDGMECNDASEHKKDVIERNDVPESEKDGRKSYCTYTQVREEYTSYHCMMSCKVFLRRFSDKNQNDYCVADGYIHLENLGKGSYRIIPLHGKSVKRSKASSCCEDTDVDSEYEDEFQDIVLSDSESRNSSKTTEEEEHEVIQKKKALLRLLKAQVKSDEKEDYFKMTPFVDDNTFNEYMTFNADLMCPVCKTHMSTFSEWKKHFYNWNACSAVFVNKKECCFSCPPCKKSFDEFTSWSVHMFMAGPHGKMRYVAFPKGFIVKLGYHEIGHTSYNEISGKNLGVESVIDEKTMENSEQQNYQEDDEFGNMFRFQVGFVCKCSKNSTFRYETSATRHIYEQHIETEDQDCRYKCNYCSKYFSSEASRKQHCRDYHGKSAEKRKSKLCNICGIWYQKRSHLLTHETKKVPCIVCGKLIKEDRLRRHIRNHSRPKRIHERHTCDICNKSFSKRHFKDHMRIHSDRSRVHCSVCGKSLLPKSMRSHMIHHGVKTIMCDLCGKKFFSQCGLKKHLKCVHQKIRREKETCTVCGAKVVSMQQHMVKHKERKYICDVCGKKFSLKHHLTTHVKGVHENLRPFVCVLCGFKFTLRHHLESHMKTSHKGSIENVGEKETVELNSYEQIAFKNDKGNVHVSTEKRKAKKKKRKSACPRKM